MMGRGLMERKPGGRVPLVAALTAATLLSGCSLFHSSEDKRPKTAVLGERIPVLTVESGAGTDASISSMPVIVPPAVENDSWTQPGGNPQKAMGNLALGAHPVRVWAMQMSKASKNERLAATPVVADGHVYVIDSMAFVRAYDAKAGRMLWSTQLKGKPGPALKEAGIGGLLGRKQHKRYNSSLFGGGVSYD